MSPRAPAITEFDVLTLADPRVRACRTVPNVTADMGLYLQMKDDFGHTASSPTFNLSREPTSPLHI